MSLTKWRKTGKQLREDFRFVSWLLEGFIIDSSTIETVSTNLGLNDLYKHEWVKQRTASLSKLIIFLVIELVSRNSFT